MANLITIEIVWNSKNLCDQYCGFPPPCLVLGSGLLYLSTPTSGLIFLLTSLLLSLASPTEVNVHSQLLQPVLSTHKMRAYSGRRSTRAMQGLIYSSWHPSRGGYTGHGTVHTRVLKHNHKMDFDEGQYYTQGWGFNKGCRSCLEIPLRHFYSSALCAGPKTGTMWS